MSQLEIPIKHVCSFKDIPAKRYFYTRRIDGGTTADSIGFWKENQNDTTAFSYEFGDSTIHPQQECWWFQPA